jgi:two-component system phosphate regulon sensor histidine kinase PhoR
MSWWTWLGIKAVMSHRHKTSISIMFYCFERRRDNRMHQNHIVSRLARILAFNGMPLCVVSFVVAAASIAGLNTQVAMMLWCAGVLLLVFGNRPSAPSVDASPSPPASLDVLQQSRSINTGHAGLAVLDTPVFVLDRQSNVIFQNASAEQNFGVVSVGEHISALLRAPALLELIREAIETSKPGQIEHVEKLPIERDYIVRVAPSAAGSHQNDSDYILTFREITDLRRIDRMRSDFIANASHELRTPLASLRGFIETLLGPAKNDEAVRDRFLNIMLDQVTRMSRLVDDLMSLSRLELRAKIAPDNSVDLRAILCHVRDTLGPLADELDVTINMHLPEQSVAVIGDRDELIQVFQNLLENACKYGQDGKEVDVWLHSDALKPIEVSVIDKGPGIAPEHVPRLTERFYRASITDSRSKKGTGLGLAIVKHILTRHKARLIIRSQVGEGTDFTVRF